MGKVLFQILFSLLYIKFRIQSSTHEMCLVFVIVTFFIDVNNTQWKQLQEGRVYSSLQFEEMSFKWKKAWWCLLVLTRTWGHCLLYLCRIRKQRSLRQEHRKFDASEMTFALMRSYLTKNSITFPNNATH